MSGAPFAGMTRSRFGRSAARCRPLSQLLAPVSVTISMCDRRPDPPCRATAGASAIPGVLEAALAGGVDVFQLRDKALGDDGLLRAAAAARELCARAGAL